MPDHRGYRRARHCLTRLANTVHFPAFGKRCSIICAVRNASAHGSIFGGSRLNANATLTSIDTRPPSMSCEHCEPSLRNLMWTPPRLFTVLSVKVTNVGSWRRDLYAVTLSSSRTSVSVMGWRKVVL